MVSQYFVLYRLVSRYANINRLRYYYLELKNNKIIVLWQLIVKHIFFFGSIPKYDQSNMKSLPDVIVFVQGSVKTRIPLPTG